MSGTDISNEHFQLAVRFVNQTNRHLFLTGKAGTGKTTFLRYIQQNSTKKMAVVAPTGVAAINAGGVTMHSFSNCLLVLLFPTGRQGGALLPQRSPISTAYLRISASTMPKENCCVSWNYW